MNSLIETFFADRYITLQCEGGECLHYSQVPGYVVSSHQSIATALCSQPRAAATQVRQCRLCGVECGRRWSSCHLRLSK